MNDAANEAVIDVSVSALPRSVTLRHFDYAVAPIRHITPGPFETPAETNARAEGLPVDGVELVAVAKDTGLRVSLRFERGQFVNLATAGLHMLDVADATELPGGGD